MTPQIFGEGGFTMELLTLRPWLAPPIKVYAISHQMFGHMHRVLNID
jgi:hypothetical protein